MEELVFNFDESEAPKAKKKDVITYEPVEKGIRRKLKNGKFQGNLYKSIKPI